MKNTILQLANKAYEINVNTGHSLRITYEPSIHGIDLALTTKSNEVFLSTIYLKWDEGHDCLKENISELDKLLTGHFNVEDYPKANFDNRFRTLPHTGHI